VLRKRVNTYDDMRAPTLEELGYISNTSLMKEFACFGPHMIHAPVEVFHPVLAITQNPVVQADQLCR
jgi:hypothetical protein